MSEPGCPIVRICPDLDLPPNSDNLDPVWQIRTRPGLNLDMSECLDFKFGHKISVHTRFFSGRTNSGIRVGQFFASPKGTNREPNALEYVDAL